VPGDADIFVSYRRTDSAGTAGRLADRLSRHFGPGRVFRDIDSIEAGEDFEQAIGQALRAASAVLIVIGPRWLEASAHDGSRRIDDPLDYVRREIEIALSMPTPVIPVLVDGAGLPAGELLPESIRELTKRNAAELSDRGWENDTRSLIEALESHGVRAETPPLPEPGARNAVLSYCRGAMAEVARFVPNLVLLLRRPRRFLEQRTHGRRLDLLAAVVFFVAALLVANTIFSLVYTPRGSAVGFVLAGLLNGGVVTIVLSVPLWVGWRVVGAKRHYHRLMAILFYQSAVAHLAFLLSVCMIVLAIDLRSVNVLEEGADEVMKSENSAGDAMRIVEQKLEPLLVHGEVQMALGFTALVLIAGAIWLVRSWGAYRDAFALARWQSVAAFAILALVGWAGLKLVGLLASHGR
jgi:TIR domain